MISSKYCRKCSEPSDVLVDKLCPDCQHIANMQSLYDFIHDTPISTSAQENAQHWRHVKRQVQLFEQIRHEDKE